MAIRDIFEAIVAFQKAEVAYRELGKTVEAANMFDWQGACSRDKKDDVSAVKMYRQAVERFTALNNNQGIADNAMRLGQVRQQTCGLLQVWKSLIPKASEQVDIADLPVRQGALMGLVGTGFLKISP